MKNAGITLIELLVVVAIIAIISAIAFPAYQDQVRKSRRTDGRSALTNIQLAQERYYTVNGTYTSSFTTLAPDLSSGLSVSSASAVTSENGYYAISFASSGTSAYELQASPQNGQENDEDCTLMTINHLGVKSGSPSDNKCW